MPMKLAASVIALVALVMLSHADSGNVSAANTTVNVGDLWFCNSSFSSTPCPTTISVGDTIT
jgi:hypothetical protein